MVANAGIAQVKSLLEMTEADIRKIFDVNVIGVFNCYQAAAKQMIKQDSGGKLIGAASIAGLKAGAMLAHYSASKFAVRGFTQGFALELAPYKINVNAYAPGIVDTPMWGLLDEKLGKTVEGYQKGDSLKLYSKNIALGRTSVPEDVAKCVSYLAGPDSDYMTGQTLVIDGGIILT